MSGAHIVPKAASVGSIDFRSVKHPHRVALLPVVYKLTHCLSLGLAIGGLDFLPGIAGIVLAHIDLSFTFSIFRLLSTLALYLGLYPQVGVPHLGSESHNLLFFLGFYIPGVLLGEDSKFI